ncbi:MAG TPA: CsbD family protein [Candidatus Limnocylindrales bacterium]|nr:CsbD family protein [Candidatus Limnocylindrales bacterium]
MNWDQIEGKWKELAGGVKERWGKLTDDELTTIGGKRDKLAGVLQQKYGMAKEKVEEEISDFERSLDDTNRRMH